MGDKLTHRTFMLKGAELDDNGILKGMAAVYGNLDDGGDIIDKGAMSGAVERFLKEGFISWGHDWNDPVAFPTDAEDTDEGPSLVAQFHSTQRAQDARTITRERLNNGLTMGLSIGYGDVVASKAQADGARHLKQIGRWYETGLVMVPMNTLAGVTEAKAGLLKSAKAAAADTRTAAYILFEVLDLIQSEAGDPDADAADLETLGTIRDLITGYLTDTATEVGTAEDIADFAAEQAARAAAGYYYMGRTLGTHAEQATSELKALVARARSIKGFRTKEGRTISSASAGKITAAIEQARSAISELEGLLASAGDNGKAARVAVDAEVARARALGVL
jgi:HK97 family phage prohead protease